MHLNFLLAIISNICFSVFWFVDWIIETSFVYKCSQIVLSLTSEILRIISYHLGSILISTAIKVCISLLFISINIFLGHFNITTCLLLILVFIKITLALSIMILVEFDHSSERWNRNELHILWPNVCMFRHWSCHTLTSLTIGVFFFIISLDLKRS